MRICINTKISSILIIRIVSILGLLCTIMYGNRAVEETCLILTFVFMLVFVIQKRFVFQWSFIIPFILCAFSCIFTMTLFGGQGVAITFMNLIMCSYSFNSIEIDEVSCRKIHFIEAMGLSIFLATCDFTYLYAGSVFTFLGNRLNSNLFGLLVLASYDHWICYLSSIEKKSIIKNIVFVIITGVSIYSIILSSCRSALLAIIIFWFLILFKKSPFKYGSFRKLTSAALLFGLIFTVFYLYLFNKIDASSAVFLGKNIFTGRQIVWDSAWKGFFESPIIGIGTSHMLNGVWGTLTASAHNTMLSILYTLGIIPTVSFVYILTKKKNCSVELQYNRYSQFAFIASLVVTIFESFYTESSLYILFLLFLIPIAYNKET